MNQLSLYTITSNMLQLLDSDDVSDESLMEVFGQIEQKNNHICHFRADILGEIAKFKAEEQRIAARRKSMETLVTRLEGYISESMTRLEVDELTAGTFSLKFQNNPPAVQVEDESLIPPRFFTVIPQSLQLNKNAVKEAIKAGEEVPGVKLTQGRSLRIR